VALVAAELARIEGRDADATRLYERAIRSAHDNGFVNNEALALEVAARFYAARGFDRIATAYLRDARSAYRQWGAEGKVRQLDERHPHLREEDTHVDPTRTAETPVERLDLAVVLQVMGAISGETDLQKLIATVMRLALEHAGADRGLLILPRGDAHRIEAEAGIGDDGVTVILHQAGVTPMDLPESLFQYVLRTRETVLLQDAPMGSALADDDYLRRHGARSVLCMPLLEQTRMVGVLYLENRLAAGVFTPARMALLKLLASEAAISIENARLYGELQEREARVRRLIDANIIGMFLWHADGRVLDANEEFLRIVGYNREDVVSGHLHWTDFSVPEAAALNARQLEALRQGGGYKAEERVYLTKDGTRVPVLTGGTMFEGTRDEGVAFVIDLTERKSAEQALREQERESRLILDTIPGPVAVLTPIGDLEAVNDEMVTFCGQPLEAMKHWGTNGTVHPDDMPHIGPIFAEAIATGKPIDNEARIRRFDGVYRRVQVRGLPLRDTFGQILRWYVLLADIEDRKRAEDALDQTREELARVARVMTLSALTASIAHEVNQPLSGIITNAGTGLRMLDADPPNVDGAREAARRALRDGHRAADVIARLRAMFSKKEFTLEPLDLNEATREVVALLLSDLQRHRVALQLELAEPLPPVLGDRVQLQQVLLNLLRNAAEAMAAVEDRPRRLVVRTESESDAGVRVIVRDAGVGVDRQSLEKLFDPFYTTKSGGMGIGLSVSRSIIERHHGRLWAEPNDGPGTTFAFSIPARQEASEDVASLTPQRDERP
jgi:PAS domain S-box-containing protein